MAHLHNTAQLTAGLFFPFSVPYLAIRLRLFRYLYSSREFFSKMNY